MSDAFIRWTSTSAATATGAIFPSFASFATLARLAGLTRFTELTGLTSSIVSTFDALKEASARLLCIIEWIASRFLLAGWNYGNIDRLPIGVCSVVFLNGLLCVMVILVYYEANALGAVLAIVEKGA